MKKTIKLSESDLMRIVKRVVNEQSILTKMVSGTTQGGGKPTVNYATKPDCRPGDNGRLVKQNNIFALSDPSKGGVYCKINTSSSSSTTQTTTTRPSSSGQSPAVGTKGGGGGKPTGQGAAMPSVR